MYDSLPLPGIVPKLQTRGPSLSQNVTASALDVARSLFGDSCCVSVNLGFGRVGQRPCGTLSFPFQMTLFHGAVFGGDALYRFAQGCQFKRLLDYHAAGRLDELGGLF